MPPLETTSSRGHHGSMSPPTSPLAREVDDSPEEEPIISRDERRSLYDEDDDGCEAFPSANHDSLYDSYDDPEDVYSDFGAIFGPGSGSTTESEDGHSFEEYLDELDGISWAVRSV